MYNENQNMRLWRHYLYKFRDLHGFSFPSVTPEEVHFLLSLFFAGNQPMSEVVSKTNKQILFGPNLSERHVTEAEEQPSPTFRLTAEQRDDVARSLRTSVLFKLCSDENVSKLVDHVQRQKISGGERTDQGQRQQFSEGEVGTAHALLCSMFARHSYTMGKNLKQLTRL